MGKKREASFEDLLEEAESIIAELEAGALPLEEALRKYEKGVANLQACAKILHAAEEKIKVLIEESDGVLRLQDFAGEEKDEEKDKESEEQEGKEGGGEEGEE